MKNVWTAYSSWLLMQSLSEETMLVKHRAVSVEQGQREDAIDLMESERMARDMAMWSGKLPINN